MGVNNKDIIIIIAVLSDYDSMFKQQEQRLTPTNVNHTKNNDPIEASEM